MKLKLLINTEIAKINGNIMFKSFIMLINGWHFNIYEQEKFHAEKEKSFITLGPGLLDC